MCAWLPKHAPTLEVECLCYDNEAAVGYPRGAQRHKRVQVRHRRCRIIDSCAVLGVIVLTGFSRGMVSRSELDPAPEADAKQAP